VVQKLFSFIDPIVDKVGSFLGSDTNITATRNLQFAKPIAASPTSGTNTATYNNQSDNRNTTVNMTLNNVKDGKTVAKDYMSVLNGVG
jgi:hypothetical protein